MSRLKEVLKGASTFQEYKDGRLVYKTESGFLFSVPVEDLGGSRVDAVEKSTVFMKWIRKALKEIESATL